MIVNTANKTLNFHPASNSGPRYHGSGGGGSSSDGVWVDWRDDVRSGLEVEDFDEPINGVRSSDFGSSGCAVRGGGIVDVLNGSSGSSASGVSGVDCAVGRFLADDVVVLCCFVKGERDRDRDRDLPRTAEEPAGNPSTPSCSIALPFPFPFSRSPESFRSSIISIPNSVDPRRELFPLTLRRATIPDPLCIPSSDPPAVGETPVSAAICRREGTEEDM